MKIELKYSVKQNDQMKIQLDVESGNENWQFFILL